MALNRSFESALDPSKVPSPSVDSGLTGIAAGATASSTSIPVQPVGSPRESEDLNVKLSAKRLSFDEKFGMGLHRLCWVLTPEAVTSHMAAVQSGQSACFGKYNPTVHTLYPDIGEQYFQKQAHGDLRRYVAALE